ncbi:pilin N-terminal domain-containing protein [Peptostreptococcus sp. D1]|uniref:pilin N-terminal domain-containing protein n=1 Tax=Peptostreptococcus sp. D1 TaxID=72304 RepID=UPI0008EF956A|nr:pilin N-terminal domain-containing protein [Peptostreptococcus sp. D1]SFE25901.1 LPXTG-motif cell wall anchor domain-containing protein/fimbrial isopeptide formation D2 domain-containing protein [Peptostreptococcus sp. D1]
MKKIKRMLSLILSLVMVVGVLAPSLYAAEEKATKTETVTLHKLLLDDNTMKSWNVKGPEGYDGTQNLEAFKKLNGASNAKEIANVYFAWQYKDGETWKYIKGKDTPELENGKLKSTDDVKEAFGKLTTESGAEFNVSNLPQDKPTEYRIVEVRELSTYVGNDGATLSAMKAVPVEITLPLVNQNGIQKNVHVYPKNTETGKPDNKKELDKNANSGEAAIDNLENKSVKIGDKIPYVVTSTIKAGSTYNKLAWSDKLSKGLTLNDDITLSSEPNIQLEKDNDYTITKENDSFVLVLTNSGLTKLAKKTAPNSSKFRVNGQGEEIDGENTSVIFTLKYSAKVNSEAVINNPLQNTNTLHYGNNPGYTPEPGDNNPPPVTPKDGKITVNKSFTNGPLASSGDVSWPNGLEITLSLQVYDPQGNKWSDVNSQNKTLNSTTTSGEWTGLDNNKQYRVIEKDVKGWVPNYAVQEDGILKIVNKKNDNPEPITPEPVIVRTGGKKFVKTNEDGKERLNGAEFIISNADGSKYLAKLANNEIDANQQALVLAETEYQNAVKKPEAADKIAELKTKRDEAAKTAAIQWKWVNSEDEAHKFITNEQGQWGVYGLAYGNYKYKEVNPPKDYAKQEEPVEFMVSATSFNTDGNIDYVAGEPLSGDKINTGDATQIKNKKITIPQTGGIGTIIFAVAGIALMGFAAYAIKRNSKED